MRFDEALIIKYDITTTHFMLPALTLQPLVENAVRHGVSKKKGGGMVCIATCEYDNRIEVVISDDGVGFDVLKKPEDNRSHVGIENTENRLRDMMGADLSIDSTIGQGTVATITIQKKGRTQ